MTNNVHVQTDSRSAIHSKLLVRTTGALYLLIAAVAAYTHFMLPAKFIVPGNAEATARQILADLDTYRWGSLGGEVVILLTEVALTVLLYVLFRRVNRVWALLALSSRLVMTGIHAVNLLNPVYALSLLQNDTLGPAAERHSLALFFLEAHHYGFAVGTVFLFVHAAALAVLIYQSGFLPKWLGGLFFLAGVGYLLDSSALLMDVYQATPGPIALVIAFSETLFPLWLLTKGIQIQRKAITPQLA